LKTEFRIETNTYENLAMWECQWPTLKSIGRIYRRDGLECPLPILADRLIKIRRQGEVLDAVRMEKTLSQHLEPQVPSPSVISCQS
jgi:hypothetical protein